MKSDKILVEFNNHLSGISDWLNTSAEYTSLTGLPTINGNIISGELNNTLTEFIQNVEGFGGEDNVIESITVNNKKITPDTNKNVNIEIDMPSIATNDKVGLVKGSDTIEIDSDGSLNLKTLSSNVSISAETTTSGTTLSWTIDGNTNSINIENEKWLSSVNYNETNKTIDFTVTNGNIVNIPVSEFIHEYTSKDFSLSGLADKSYNSLDNIPTINDNPISGEISSYITSLPGYGGDGKLYTAGNRIEIKDDDNSINWIDMDYTAFEVYPTDHIILSGSTEIGENVWNDNTLTVMYEIPSSMTEEFALWITKSRLESDIIIDWGDGVIEKLSELTPTNGTANDGKIDVLVYVAHKYEIPNQTYIVKVYGKDYCRLSHLTKLSTDNRLVCRVFDTDLPVASHLTNLASYCLHCVRLLKVSIPSYSDMLHQVVNLASLFEGCKNLIYAYGFDKLNNDIVPGGVNNVFSGCNGLLEIDFKIPATFTSARNLFYNCERLEIDIASVFSNGSLSNVTIDPAGMFAGTKKLFGIVPAEKLWNNTNVIWKTYSSDVINGGKPFVYSSDAIREQVPKSWGGKVSDDDIIEKSLEEKYAELEEKYNEIISRLDSIGTIDENGDLLI